MPIIQSVERALRILDLFDEQTPELKITEMSSMMNLHKSTLHSLLLTLKTYGYIDQDAESGKYRLGTKLLERGQMLLQSLDIRAVARKSLEALSRQTGQTTHLVVLEGREGVYIDKVEGEKAAIRYSRIGRRVPLHTSAVGKVLAAYLREHERERLLEGYRFVPHTPNSIQDAAAFREELAKVRQAGFALDNEENEPGVRCAAVPILDHAGKVAAAMSVSTMVSVVDEGQLRQFVDLMKQHAQMISRQLGYREQEENP